MRNLVCGLLLAVICVSHADAAVNLLLLPESDPAPVGGVARFQLVAINDAEKAQAVAAIDVVLNWDAAELGQITFDDNGPYAWLASGFLPDADSVNLATDDGDAVYTALASPAPPALIPANGELLVTTLEFEVLSATPSASVDIAAEQGLFAQTRVLAPSPPQLNILGSFKGSSVTLVGCASADFDTDGDVDLVDFAAFQQCFSGNAVEASPVCECTFDFEPDGDVDSTDFEVFHSLITGPIP